MELVVNGHRAGIQSLPASAATVSWNVPPQFWRAGLNALVFEIKGAGRPSQAGASSDTRLLGVAVTSLVLTEVPDAKQPSGTR